MRFNGLWSFPTEISTMKPTQEEIARNKAARGEVVEAPVKTTSEAAETALPDS